MPGSDKSASGTSSTCHHSRTETATRVAGTDDHLTRPDSENNSASPEQVHGTTRAEDKAKTMVMQSE